MKLSAVLLLIVASAVSIDTNERILDLEYNCIVNCTISQRGDNCFQLTDDLPLQRGGVWSVNPVEIMDYLVVDFEMHFGSRGGVVGSTTNPGADGIAFVLQNQGPNSLGRSGGGLGFSGISPSVGVEFDTYQNGGVSGDPSSDHVALVRDGKLHTGKLTDPSELGFSLENGMFHTARFEWIKIDQTIRVSVNGTVVLTKSSIDLESLLGNSSFAYLGFTASTGHASNRHVVCVKSVRRAIFKQPSISPSDSRAPSESPSMTPSSSLAPSAEPSRRPSLSVHPSRVLSTKPSTSNQPSSIPSESPAVSGEPTGVPSEGPSRSTYPSNAPSITPSTSRRPSDAPVSAPAAPPTETPVEVISTPPSSSPTSIPSEGPSISGEPPGVPSASPSRSTFPSNAPSVTPSTSRRPSDAPVSAPVTLPSEAPVEVISAPPSSSPMPHISSLSPSAIAVPSRSPSVAFVPDFKCHGNCSVVSYDNNCYQLTDDVNKRQVGAVWSVHTLDLTMPFAIDAALYFGTNDGATHDPLVKNYGADGIAFVLQNQGSSVLGGPGGGIGLAGIMPSIAIKFDTYQNNASSGDLPGDHVGMIKDGRLVNGRLSPLIELGYNLEDGQFHNMTFEWDSVNQAFSVYVNTALILTKAGFNLLSFLGNKTFAYPGFTSSTGESTNRHVVCIKAIRAHFHESVAPEPIPSSRPVSTSGPSPNKNAVPTSAPSPAMMSSNPLPVQTSTPSGTSTIAPLTSMMSSSPLPARTSTPSRISTIAPSASMMSSSPLLVKTTTPSMIAPSPEVMSSSPLLAQTGTPSRTFSPFTPSDVSPEAMMQSLSPSGAPLGWPSASLSPVANTAGPVGTSTRPTHDPSATTPPNTDESNDKSDKEQGDDDDDDQDNGSDTDDDEEDKTDGQGVAIGSTGGANKDDTASGRGIDLGSSPAASSAQLKTAIVVAVLTGLLIIVVL